MTRGRRGLWVSIDGTEGTGKTTIADALIPELAAEGINEFSDTLFGDALRQAVVIAPHFISESPLGQSLVFLGDFIELYHSKIVPALNDGRIVVTDRGWLTKYTYQSTVLQRTMSYEAADQLLRHILSFVPPPDLTILLHAPLCTIRQRLLERDGFCDDARAGFIETAAAAAREFADHSPELKFVELETNRPVSETVADAKAIVDREVNEG